MMKYILKMSLIITFIATFLNTSSYANCSDKNLGKRMRQAFNRSKPNAYIGALMGATWQAASFYKSRPLKTWNTDNSDACLDGPFIMENNFQLIKLPFKEVRLLKFTHKAKNSIEKDFYNYTYFGPVKIPVDKNTQQSFQLQTRARSYNRECRLLLHATENVYTLNCLRSAGSGRVAHTCYVKDITNASLCKFL